MVVCVLIPRFALAGALGDRRELLQGPVALAPDPGGEQRIGEASAAAETFGVAPGMTLGEALTRCPALRLVPPDPEGVRALWRHVIGALEQIGASVESDRPGSAFFEAEGMRRLHGGRLADVLEATRHSLRRTGAGGGRLGAGPSRFAAYAAATRARPARRPEVVPPERAAVFLAPLSVRLLSSRSELAELPELLERLGIRTLCEYAALPSPAVFERFGHPGLLALDLAQGRDTPLVPQCPPEPVMERLTLPESVSGLQLERALDLLVGRVLARTERRGRTLRSLVLVARFVEGGTWRARTTLREASADPSRIRLALRARLGELVAPVESIGLEVEAFGPPATRQDRLIAAEDGEAVRRSRLDEAVRQVREAAGPGAALRVMEVDPRSRVPERRALLAPYPVEERR